VVVVKASNVTPVAEVKLAVTKPFSIHVHSASLVHAVHVSIDLSEHLHCDVWNAVADEHSPPATSTHVFDAGHQRHESSEGPVIVLPSVHVVHVRRMLQAGVAAIAARL
jgi:hypothetical protein